MSTVPPATIRALEAARPRSAARGSSTRRCRAASRLAEAGKLTLMVGGEAEDLERARPVLEPLAKPIFHLGPLGTGAAMKLAVNTVIFGLNRRVAEALVLAEAAGIDRATRVRRLRGERRRRAVRRLQAGRVRRPGRDARRVLARARREGPAAHHRRSPTRSAWPCRRPRINLALIRGGRRRSAAIATSRPSPSICAAGAGATGSRRRDGRSAERRCPEPLRWTPGSA